MPQFDLSTPSCPVETLKTACYEFGMIHHLLLFIILTLGSSNLFSCDKSAVFQIAYTDDYVHAAAAYNVGNLLKRFQKNGASLEGMDVVYFLHENRVLAGGPTLPGPLLPKFERVPVPKFQQIWKYHAVVLDNHTGEIYDLETTEVLAVKDHYNRFFARPGEDVAGKIIIKRLGAQQFLDLLAKHNVTHQREMLPVIQTIRGETPQWPAVPLSDLLRAYP